MSQFQNDRTLSPKGPEGFEAPVVQMYQEGKTILPNTKVGVGYSGINMTAVAQSALQLGSELYTGYKENQVAEKEALLKKEAQDMSDRLDIYTIKNDWKSAEAEKPAHQARVKEILGYDPNEKASSRLGSMALSMSASYNAKVAVGSMQEKDAVENTAIVAYTNRMKSDIANAKTIAERDRLTDEMERFSRQELDRLGYTSSVNTDKSQVYGGMPMVALNNTDITAESLTGRSAVERDRILKLQDLLLTSQDARTKHLASDSKAEAEYQEKLKKASLFDIYATLSGSEQVGQGVTKQISELETLLAQKANEGGNIANDEYLKLRANTLSNIYQMQNTVNGTIQHLLKQAGVTNPEEFITDEGNFNYLEVIPFLTRAMGEDGKEIITKLGNMTAMIDAGKTGVLSREARTTDSIIAKEYKQRETNVKLLRVSYDTAISAINSSTAPEFDKNRARLSALANLEQNIMKEFEYLNPEWKAASQERSRLTSPDPRIPQQAGGRIRELLQRGSDIPGLELDAFVNATAQFDSRGLKQPNYAAAAFAQAYELYNEAQRKAFPEGTSSASKAQAIKEAELKTDYKTFHIGNTTEGNASLTPERQKEAVSYNAATEWGYVYGMSLDDSPDGPGFLSHLKAIGEKNPDGPKFLMRDLLVMYPELVNDAIVTGNDELNALKTARLDNIYSQTSQAAPTSVNAVQTADLPMSKELATAVKSALLNASRTQAHIDVPSLGGILLSQNPQSLAQLIAGLKSSAEFSNGENLLFTNAVNFLGHAQIAYKADDDPRGFMAKLVADKGGLSPDDTAQLNLSDGAVNRAIRLQDGAAVLKPLREEAGGDAAVAQSAYFADVLAPVMREIFPQLALQGTTEPLEFDALLENSNAKHTRNELFRQFQKAITEITIFNENDHTPAQILESETGKAMILAKMQENMSGYEISPSTLGPQLIAARDQMFRPSPIVEPDVSHLVNAKSGFKEFSLATELFTKSISVVPSPQQVVTNQSLSEGQIKDNNYPLWLQFGTKKAWEVKPNISKAFAKDPVGTSIAAQVPTERIPALEGFSRAETHKLIFQAAAKGDDSNGNILAAIAALNSFEFDPTATIENTQKEVQARVWEIKEALNGDSSNYRVEYRSEMGNAGEVNRTTLVVLSAEGKTLAKMQTRPESVNSNAPGVSLKGKSPEWLQEAMVRDTKDMVTAGVPYEPSRNGNDAVIVQWFADNPDKDTVSLRRKGKAPVFSLDLPEWMGRGFVAETWRGQTTYTYKRGIDHDNKGNEVVLDVTHTAENSITYDHMKYRDKKTKYPVVGIIAPAKPTFYPSPNVKAMSGPSIFTDPLEGPTPTYPTREEAEASFDELPPDVQKYIDEFQKFGGPNFNSPLQAPPLNGVATDRVYDNTNSQADFDRQLANWPTDAIDRELTDGKLRYPTDLRWLSDPSNFNSQMAPPKIGGVDRLDAYEVKDPGLGLPPPGPNDGAIFDTQMRNAARAASADIINDMSGKINAVANAQKYVIDRASDFNNDVMDSAVNSFMNGVGPLRTPAPEEDPEYLNFQKIAASTLNGLLQPSNVTLPLHILQVLREPRPTDAQLTELANYRNRQIARGSQSKPIELSYGASKPRMDTSPRPEPVWESVPPPDTNVTIPSYIAEYFKDLSEDQLRELKAYGKLYPKDYFGPRTH